QNCFPFVCDLATANDLPVFFKSQISNHQSRIITFFGMIPNFEPREILPKLASLIRPKDLLLFGANLAPGKNYTSGMKEILPQYDNPQTRDWLLAFLLDLGIEKSDGRLKFEIATGDFGLKRFAANFHFKRAWQIEIENESFNFKSGGKIRLFFFLSLNAGTRCKNSCPAQIKSLRTMDCKIRRGRRFHLSQKKIRIIRG
ncbi:MAG TPA: hypothetical protein VGM58_00260, partial [Verrucomicrobiae bacterium]